MGKFVYKAVRAAASNAKTTEVPTGGVLRDYKVLPQAFAYADPVQFVDVPGEQYRTAILNSSVQGDTEYLLWAANGGSLSIGDPTWVLEDGAGTIPTGMLVDTGAVHTDGSDSIIVTGGDGRTVTSVVRVEVVRGDVPGSVITVVAFGSVSLTGRVTFDGATLLSLDGGVFQSRGDYIKSVWYQTEPVKFWWSRNDPQRTRFGWNNQVQRWEPYKGSSVKDLGLLTPDGRYLLSPRPNQLNRGETLPGEFATPDTYAMVRLGQYPDSNSDPVAADGPGAFTGIEIVSDEEAQGTGFVWGTQAGIVGETGGVLQWNPVFLNTYAGKTVWYTPQDFETDVNGFVGNISVGNHLHIAPIPGPTDYPFIRVGTCRYLNVLVVADEATQAGVSPALDEVVVALSTGKLKFNSGLLAKADPTDPAFDIQYLGAEVYYDGVALTQQPVPTVAPAALTGPLDDLYAPLADFATDLGTSGVLYLPDQTGLVPQPGTPGIRPGGDTLAATATGLVRQAETFGDLLIFGSTRVLEKVIVVDTENDAPKHAFKIPAGTAYLSRDTGRVFLSRKDQHDFAGQQLYILQALCRPAVSVPRAVLYSRLASPFTLEGADKLYFALDSTSYVWTSTLGAGTFTAQQIVTNIQANTAPAIAAWQVAVVGDQIILQDALAVEIGWGASLTDKDLSGARALGFLPGWRATAAGGWLPDSGFAFGLERSPVNLDRTGPESDALAEYRTEDLTLSKSVKAQPFMFLDQIPIQDVAGYDDDVFYRLTSTVQRGSTSYTVTRQLQNFVNVKYDFGQKKLLWLDSYESTSLIQQPTSAFYLGQLNVIPETMYLPSNGVWVSRTGGPLQKLVYGEDFILPNSGVPGVAQLIRRVGDTEMSGARGQFTALSSSFTDPDADFTSVQDGYILKILVGEAEGSYVVTSAVPAFLTVTPAFAVSSPSATPTEWVVYKAHRRDVYDASAPVVLADVTYREFNHLTSEPFKIHALSYVGDVPVDATAQFAHRLVADAGEALEKGRDIEVRIGLVSPAAWAVYVLQKALLGKIANNSLLVNLTSPRVLVESFGLRLGAQLFSFTDPGHPISMVGAFSVPIPVGTIECLTTTGEIGFASDLLVDYQESDVYFTETFLDPTAFLTGTVELDPETGGLNFSSVDMTSFGGQEAYFVERMITEGREDVAISPVVGTFAFNTPLKAWQVVQADYYLADSSGNKALDDAGNEIHVLEYLPVYIQREICTATANPNVYAFNPTGRYVFPNIVPTVYVGAVMMNYASETATFDGNTVLLSEIPAVGDVVTISYAVLHSFGGESTYTSSQKPIYRPPFFLQQGQDTFTLAGDRTSEVQTGCLLRLGEAPFYITSSAYASGVTTVMVSPTPVAEAGSRAPGNDSLTLLSSEPVNVPNFIWVTPGIPFEKVPKNGRSVTVLGDILSYAVPGHLMEIGGIPFIIAGARRDDTGTKTIVEWTSVAPYELQGSLLRISVRPIYPPSASVFLGLGGLIPDEPYELILFGNGVPGRSLVPNIEYGIDPATGGVSLLRDTLQPNQWLYFRYTGLDTLAPTYQSGVFVLPRVKSKFSYMTTPSEDNGILDGYLQASFSFRNPDTFYAKVTPLLDFMSEVSRNAVEAVKSRQPTSGPMLPSNTTSEPGGVSLVGEKQELQNEDRAARAFLSFYNQVISTFEQVQETIGSGIVGDRDGKFKFSLGPETEVAGPGSEDDISGLLNPKNLWTNVFMQLLVGPPVYGSPVYVTSKDPLVHPLGLSLTGGVLDGSLPSIDYLNEWIQLQKGFVENEVDDVILTGVSRLQRTRGSWPPGLHLKAFGKFLSLADPSRFSRIFPEETTVFTTTGPGIGADELTGDPGEYAYAKVVDSDGTIASTFLTAIGEVSNPVLGTVENIQSIVTKDRYPRARIWAYSAIGFPELDAQIFAYEPALGPTYFASDPRPAVIATPLPLKDFPLTTGGLPDVTQFVSLGGTVSDLASGDYDLHISGFEGFPTAQVGFGRPDGTLFDVGYGAIVIPFSSPTTAPVYVADVILGCILTFKARHGTNEMDVTNGNLFVQFDGGIGGPALSLNEGDTVYLHTPGREEMENTTDPLTTDDMERVSQGLPAYRDGVDVGVNKKNGEFLDLTFPRSFQKLFGQKTPQPVSPIEAKVQFTSGNMSPLEIPALTGQDKNDSGDYTLPYLKTQNTELDRLGNVDPYVGELFADNFVVSSGVYPDEFVGTDGAVFIGGLLYPASLQTAVDVAPAFTPGSGLGTLAPFDLLLTEVGGSALPVGCQGILSVGRVERIGATTYIEPPRFITPTVRGDVIRYTFDNAQAFVQDPQPVGPFTPGNTEGVKVEIDYVAHTTTFDFSSVPALEWAQLHDGLAAGVGGLNSIWGLGANSNRIILKLYQRELGAGEGAVVETVVIEGLTVTGSSGTVAITSAQFGVGPGERQLVIGGWPLPFLDVTRVEMPFTVVPLVSAISDYQYDYTISLDTYNAGTGQSTTAYVDRDRLTFVEVVDFTTVKVRGAVHPKNAGTSIEGRLKVDTITGTLGSDLTINAIVNTGIPFTFLQRAYGTGTWIPAALGGDELGTIRVMAFEGSGNTELPADVSDVVFSALPSSICNTTGLICDSSGMALKGSDWVSAVPPATGVLNVEAGDTLVIKSACAKAGTYLVRHGVESNNLSDTREVVLEAAAGVSSSWVDIQFPTLVSWDSLAGTVTISDTFLFSLSPTGHAFRTAGFTQIYFLTQVDGPDTKLVYASYAGIAGNTFNGLNLFRDENDNPVSATDFWNSLSAGMSISGMVYLPIHVGGEQGLPNNNVVGGAGVCGFTGISIQNGTALPRDFDAISAYPVAVGDEIGVGPAIQEPSNVFQSDPDTVVYPNVAGLLDVSVVVTWPCHTGPGVRCFVPGDRLVTSTVATPIGFEAQAGIFLEPSFPMPALPLGGGSALVVDATHGMAANHIGFREDAAYVGVAEPVAFEVRRIRRFHEVQNLIGEALYPLRYTYLIRRGTVTGYAIDPDNKGFMVVAAGGTNLGYFDDPDVNIQAGDTFRVRYSGSVYEATIGSVVSGTFLMLSVPGLGIPVSPVGMEFEVYLKRVPVPHVQSNEQLFSLIQSELLVDRTADYTTGAGGSVATTNELADSGIDFVTAQVQPGDILVVDPAGALSGQTGLAVPPEYGMRPYGDLSVFGRVPYVAGKPSEMDDNRGFYKVQTVNAGSLVVSPETSFSGTAAPVVFGGAGYEYAVYPTVHDSDIPVPGSPEGQMDLRLTAPAGIVTNSFKGTPYSVQPFSYRVIRPSGQFSEEAVYLVLFMRERMLSWIEQIGVFLDGNKHGSYFVFQRDEHIEDLGDPAIPELGLGVIFNALVYGLRGVVGATPFANDADCLSLLDRRFWILDRRLDFLNYTDYEGVGASVRPVLPDLIDLVLEFRDAMRQQRYFWLDYRTNRISGTLAAMKRFDEEYPRRVKEKEDLLLMLKGSAQ